MSIISEPEETNKRTSRVGVLDMSTWTGITAIPLYQDPMLLGSLSLYRGSTYFHSTGVAAAVIVPLAADDDDGRGGVGIGRQRRSSKAPSNHIPNVAGSSAKKTRVMRQALLRCPRNEKPPAAADTASCTRHITDPACNSAMPTLDPVKIVTLMTIAPKDER